MSDTKTAETPAAEKLSPVEGVKANSNYLRGQIPQELVDGTNAAWTAVPYEYGMWLLADQMARHATGVWDAELEAEASIVPTWVVDSADVAESLLPTDGWTGPEDFKDSFMALWGVSS